MKVVLDWPFPKSVKEVQKFLGLANYYMRFVKYFAKIVRPLHELMRKSTSNSRRYDTEKTVYYRTNLDSARLR